MQPKLRHHLGRRLRKGLHSRFPLAPRSKRWPHRVLRSRLNWWCSRCPGMPLGRKLRPVLGRWSYRHLEMPQGWLPPPSP